MKRFIALLLLGSCAAPPAPAPVEVAPERALSDARFHFCHDAHEPVPEEADFCELLQDDPVARRLCPGLASACTGEIAATQVPSGGCDGERAMRQVLQPNDQPAAGDAPVDDPREPMGCEAPKSSAEWLSAMLRWLAAGFVAILVLVFLRVAVHFMGVASEPEAEVLVERPPVLPQTVAHDDVPDVPSHDLLSAATQALAEARYADVVLLCRAATLRALAETRRIRLHRARTDREYARQVRRELPLYEPLHALLSAAERLRWGGWTADRQAADAALAAARRLLAALGPLAALLVLMGAGGMTLRYGAQYDAGLLRAFQLAGYEATFRAKPLAELDATVTDVVLVDLSGLAPSDASWEGLHAFAEAGGVVVIGGDPEDEWPELGVGELLDEPAPLERGDALLAAVDLPVVPGGASLVYRDLDEAVLVLATAAGEPSIVLLKVGEGAVLVVGEEVLMWNGSLVSAANERFWGALWEQLVDAGVTAPKRRPVVELATLSAASSDSSSSSSSPLQSMLNANVLPFVLQLMLAMALAALWKGSPFAPLRDPSERGRDRFADHAEAMGLRYARLGASGHAASRYAAWALARYGRMGLITAVVKGGRDRASASAFVARIEHLATEGADGAASEHFALMEELWTLIQSTKAR